MDLTIIRKFIPFGLNRIGKEMVPRYITIHETSLGILDTDAKYNITYYYNSLLAPRPGREEISYHYIVDDKSVVNFVPDTEVCYHCGDGEFGTGNTSSIGIERCVFSGINHLSAIDNQAKLTAYLMHKYNIPVSNVVMHNYWRNTPCPSRLSNNMLGGFSFFISRVMFFYTKK